MDGRRQLYRAATRRVRVSGSLKGADTAATAVCVRLIAWGQPYVASAALLY